MKAILDIFTSHVVARVAGAALVIYLYAVDQQLLAAYSVTFASLHLLSYFVKFGFAQKVFRDSAASLDAGEDTLKKFNSVWYFFGCAAITSSPLFSSPVIIFVSLVVGFSSVRYAFLTGAGRLKTAIFFEFTLPMVLIFTLFYFQLFRSVEEVLLFAYIPGAVASMLLLPRAEFLKPATVSLADLKSGAFFLLSALTQQLNSYVVILLFNANFSFEVVSNLRLVQVLVTPMQLVNVSFSIAFQKLANGNWRLADSKFNMNYIIFGVLTAVVTVLLLSAFQHYDIYAANYPQIWQFFICFLGLYSFRILFFFADTRLIIARKEDLIFRINFLISVLICVVGMVFSYAKLPALTYLIFNSGPLLLASSCYFWATRYESSI